MALRVYLELLARCSEQKLAIVAERRLAELAGVSRNGVRGALQELERRRFVVVTRGLHTFQEGQPKKREIQLLNEGLIDTEDTLPPPLLISVEEGEEAKL